MLIALFLAVMAAAWLIDAQNDNKFYQSHGAVVLSRTGERTPEILVKDAKILTTTGSQQMYALGQQFRSRYIKGQNGTNGLGQQLINGLSPNLLDNDQLYILALDSEDTISSAQAFMQGFYPPYKLNNPTAGFQGSGGDPTGVLANSSVVEAPMGGYQYPRIHVAGEVDAYSAFIAGDQECSRGMVSKYGYFLTNDYSVTKANSQEYYDTLDVNMFNGLLEKSSINYDNAYFIYDYLSYQYAHDSTTYGKLSNSNDTTYAGVYDHLRSYADNQAWYFYGNTTHSSPISSDLQAMAGRTAASLILGQFQDLVHHKGNTTNGHANLLTLLFSEHAPLISLLSLLQLDTNPDNKNFRTIPPYASSLVFELYSMSDSNDTTFPSNPSDLWVRFFFHNGSIPFDSVRPSLQAYSLFGLGHAQDPMPWPQFNSLMSGIMVSELNDWCELCNAPSLFCWGIENSTAQENGGGGHSKMSPAVGGVIGAVVTLAVAGIIFALAMLLGGLRFHRVHKSKKSELGGFKGSAKLASDADLHLPKAGAAAGITSIGDRDRDAETGPKERVGSWELRAKEMGKDTGEGESRRESLDAIEAAMGRAVVPVERV